MVNQAEKCEIKPRRAPPGPRLPSPEMHSHSAPDGGGGPPTATKNKASLQLLSHSSSQAGWMQEALAPPLQPRALPKLKFARLDWRTSFVDKAAAWERSGLACIITLSSPPPLRSLTAARLFEILPGETLLFSRRKRGPFGGRGFGARGGAISGALHPFGARSFRWLRT